jgi:formylmethanofuran dehydrogenase subunit E
MYDPEDYGFVKCVSCNQLFLEEDTAPVAENEVICRECAKEW